MERGLDFKPIVTGRSHVQMLELRDFQVQEILRLLAIPSELVSDPVRPTGRRG